jgi:hypothetical protein
MQARVHGDCRRAERPARVQDLDVRGTVLRNEGDPRPRLHAELDEAAGKALDPFCELSVTELDAVAFDDGDGARDATRGTKQGVSEIHTGLQQMAGEPQS